MQRNIRSGRLTAAEMDWIDAHITLPMRIRSKKESSIAGLMAGVVLGYVSLELKGHCCRPLTS
jgi:hypothetical protein